MGAKLKQEGGGQSADEKRAAELKVLQNMHLALQAPPALSASPGAGKASEEEEEEEEGEDHHVMPDAHSGMGEGRAGKKVSVLDEYGEPIPAMAKYGYIGGLDAPFPPDPTRELSFEEVCSCPQPPAGGLIVWSGWSCNQLTLCQASPALASFTCLPAIALKMAHAKARICP